jgi:hypothetical protein
MKYAVLLLALMFAGVSMASMAQKPKEKPTIKAYKAALMDLKCQAVTKREACQKCEANGEYGGVGISKKTCSKCEGVSDQTLAKFPCSSCSNTRQVKDPNYVPPRKCEVCNGRGKVLTLGHKFQVADADYSELLDWDDAKYVTSQFGSGWRLPTIDELTGMYEFLHGTRKGNFKDFWYWSSSEDDADNALGFSFANGQATSYYYSFKNYTFQVRAVRALP